jgi:hypothetical protein
MAAEAGGANPRATALTGLAHPAIDPKAACRVLIGLGHTGPRPKVSSKQFSRTAIEAQKSLVADLVGRRRGVTSLQKQDFRFVNVADTACDALIEQDVHDWRLGIAERPRFPGNLVEWHLFGQQIQRQPRAQRLIP